MTQAFVIFDIKEINEDGIDTLKKALEKFGIFVYRAEEEVSDDWTVILSDKQMSKDDVKKYIEEVDGAR
jgi:hypothetical protein